MTDAGHLKQVEDELDLAQDDVTALEGKLQTAEETIQRLRNARVGEIEERPEPKVCWWREWPHGDGIRLTMETDCNLVVTFHAGFSYCPKCGKPLEII